VRRMLPLGTWADTVLLGLPACLAAVAVALSDKVNQSARRW
jgi:hypothetical protein